MLILGHGVKIKAPIKGINGWGIKSDTICFGGDEDDIFPSSDRCNRTTNCGVFDLATAAKLLPQKFVVSFALNRLIPLLRNYAESTWAVG
ncbi:BnaC09g14780D [Brassica napus]|uniref:(rape) hypothetical protein n=1 Tax=Brassica napus TaxID=3708 RepID=A0A078ID07_BRANA|nr:unnamed protein product [Brassica napus]CDY47229.1 BnaC09g14780D [Brassica napus]